MTPHLHPWTKEEAALIKGLWADEGGRKAIDMLVGRVCGLMSASMVIGDTHLTAHMEGRRWVARSIMHAVRTPMEQLTGTTNEPDGSRILTATERAARATAEHAKRGA